MAPPLSYSGQYCTGKQELGGLRYAIYGHEWKSVRVSVSGRVLLTFSARYVIRQPLPNIRRTQHVVDGDR